MCEPYGCWIIQLFVLAVPNDYTYENLEVLKHWLEEQQIVKSNFILTFSTLHGNIQWEV